MRFVRHTILVATFLGALTATAQTQQEMNVQACEAYTASSNELNDVFQKVQQSLKDKNPLYAARLRSAQEAWLRFRDAELELMYPVAEEKDAGKRMTQQRVSWGSVYPTCKCVTLKELTQERTQELRRWLDGLPEGETCGGTLPVKRR